MNHCSPMIGPVIAFRPGRWLAALWVVVVMCVVAGCAGGGLTVKPKVDVRPATSRLVQPVSTRVTGLKAGHLVSITLSSTDANGLEWASTVRLRASRDGTVDLDRTAASGGSYRGSNGMGLMETLQPTQSTTAGPYWWSPAGNQFMVTVKSSTGQVLVRSMFRRRVGPEVQDSEQSVAEQGFDGVYYRREPGGAAGGLRPAILAFGGSEGGNSMILPGNALAASGYPTLTIAYFGAPGLPQHLVKIRLEYFARALRWLRHQPGVDPDQIYVLGVSRGSEAAQLLAVHYPNLVHGVILGVPSGVVQVGLTGGAGTAAKPAGVSAWSFRGKPIPFTTQFNDPHPTLVPASVIPDEDIRGPMFLDCGGSDQVWVSCPFAKAIMNRLDGHHDRYRHVLAEYPQAGHGVGSFVPYEPSNPKNQGSLAGAQPESNQVALAKVWPRLMEFLHSTSQPKPR